MRVLGVDIGGSGIKGAVVDTATGQLQGGRHRVPTPQPATPEAVTEALVGLAEHFSWRGPVGCGFPAVLQRGVAKTAANIDSAWIGDDVRARFGSALGAPCWLLNDADAAAMAEMRFGAGRDQRGVVLLITIGTGLGTALFVDGHLLPNSELGHIVLPRGEEAEDFASDGARKREGLDWDSWAARFDEFLHAVAGLVWPELIILGGGAAKKMERFAPRLTVEVPVVPAAALNQAGLVGAALFAAKNS